MRKRPQRGRARRHDWREPGQTDAAARRQASAEFARLAECVEQVFYLNDEAAARGETPAQPDAADRAQSCVLASRAAWNACARFAVWTRRRECARGVDEDEVAYGAAECSDAELAPAMTRLTAMAEREPRQQRDKPGTKPGQSVLGDGAGSRWQHLQA